MGFCGCTETFGVCYGLQDWPPRQGSEAAPELRSKPVAGFARGAGVALEASEVALPQRMTIKHGRYYHVAAEGERRIWTPLSRDLAESIDMYWQIDKPTAPAAMTPPHELAKRDIMSHLRRMMTSAKIRAGKSGMGFSLTADDLVAMLDASGWRCSLTGIAFDMEAKHRKGARPFVPSIDRIDSRKGYTPDNVRIICFAVNMALNAWGHGVLHQVITSYVTHNGLRVARRPSARRTAVPQLQQRRGFSGGSV